MSTPIKTDPVMRPTLQKKSRAITGWILLAFAVLAGLGAAYLAVHTLNAKESALKQRLLSEMSPKKEITVAAVVPIENLPANTILTLSMVAREESRSTAHRPGSYWNPISTKLKTKDSCSRQKAANR